MNKIRAFDYYSLRQRELMDFLRAVGEWGKHDPQFMAICSVVVYALIDKYNKMEEIFIPNECGNTGSGSGTDDNFP